MRKSPTLTITFVVCLIAFTALGAIIRYTDKPNAVPVGSDFLSLQRNSDYINASVNQFSNMLFFNPTFGGVMTGNGGGLFNVPGVNGGFILSASGFGTNTGFYGPTTFYGTNNYGKMEIFDNNSIYVAGFDTNKGGFWGFGNLAGFTNLAFTSILPFSSSTFFTSLTDDNGATWTNLTYKYTTNIVGAANFVFGKAYWTNVTGNWTFPALTMQDAAAMETLAVWVTNSSGATVTATINGVAGAPGHVVPALFYCTNATVTEIDVSHFGILWTNACVGKN